MKVLFVCSGNIEKFGISPITINQGESLRKEGILLDYFDIKGKGLLKYIKNIFILRKHLVNKDYNILHAHYSLSGIVASLASRNIPIVVSLMGSDIHSNLFWRYLIKFFYKFRWNKTIVKSIKDQKHLKLSKSVIIPNGVDFEKFIIMDKLVAREKVNFDPRKKYIIFIANPKRKEKNLRLAKEAVDMINDLDVELFVVFNENGVDHNLIPIYMNAADVLLLTSKREGSPNVIKEALACNCPIVATDVGDVKEIINNSNGCFLTSFDANDIARKLNIALEFKGKTNSRENISYLDNKKVADKIINLYKSLLRKNNKTKINIKKE